MLHSINRPNFIVWLSLLLELLGNMCITIVSQAVMLWPIFLIKPFWYMSKKSTQKLKYLENEKSFWAEIKNDFLSFLKRFQLPEIVSDLRVCL